MTTAKLREAFQFFRQRAGCVTPPGPAASALRLARAELWGEDHEIEWELHPEQDAYADVYGEDPPEGAEFYWIAAKLNGEVVASLGFVEDDDYLRVVKAELLVEAQARVEQIEAAEAAAAKDAEQRDAALRIVWRLAACYRDPHQQINGGDLVDEVGTLLAGAGFITEARITYIEAHGLKVEREGQGETYTVTGPDQYHVTGGDDVLEDAYQKAVELAQNEVPSREHDLHDWLYHSDGSWCPYTSTSNPSPRDACGAEPDPRRLAMYEGQRNRQPKQDGG